ncbi:hypothetical protein [Vibrio parahaemolyticus]|uniref:hypothetical protein n=1 Tax=Vibrio parahaemolyticus TaxID=670 RepID=UPI0004DEE88D|nr:hypothetical protein [Vibrio parahaemolyticus]
MSDFLEDRVARLESQAARQGSSIEYQGSLIAELKGRIKDSESRRFNSAEFFAGILAGLTIAVFIF